MVYFSNEQKVIDEINYNPPESGIAYLEYFEILNAANLPNYSIKDALVLYYPDCFFKVY